MFFLRVWIRLGFGCFFLKGLDFVVFDRFSAQEQKRIEEENRRRAEVRGGRRFGVLAGEAVQKLR